MPLLFAFMWVPQEVCLVYFIPLIIGGFIHNGAMANSYYTGRSWLWFGGMFLLLLTPLVNIVVALYLCVVFIQSVRKVPLKRIRD